VALGLWLVLAAGAGPFWQDARNVMLAGVERLADGDFAEAVPLLEEAARRQPDSALAHAWTAHAFHLARRLDEAATRYARVLSLEPSREPNAAEKAAILRHAPRVFQVASDPFRLLAAVAVHHPDEPLIAYHFFWEDDIDFPADNDPCDHELVWVRYDRSNAKVTEFHTYFHGRILGSTEAVRDAAAHSERPRVNVQWGKHGSLPAGWENVPIAANAGDIERSYLDRNKTVTVGAYNLAAYKKLHEQGREAQAHPRTRAWPTRFEGTWEDFVRFDQEVPYRDQLAGAPALAVSRWNNAVLQQDFLAFNFRPKTEWPDVPAGPPKLEAQLERRVGAASEGLLGREEALALRQRAGRSSDPFTIRMRAASSGHAVDLPPMAPFRPETPRFPNLWLQAPANRFPQYAAFVRDLQSRLRQAGFTAGEVELNEGADAAFSIEHLQPWGDVPGLAHAHALHVRLFWKRLQMRGLHRADDLWRVAASVHYEVEHASPLHADVRSCPHCGRTGTYAGAGHLVEMVHDPLGLELILTGAVRGEKLVAGLAALFAARPEDVSVRAPHRPDMNTGAVAIVTLR
jgi:tetratricopeptide (TPR) repeat protein